MENLFKKNSNWFLTAGVLGGRLASCVVAYWFLKAPYGYGSIEPTLASRGNPHDAGGQFEADRRVNDNYTK